MEDLLEQINASPLPFAAMASSLIGVYVQGHSNLSVLIPSLENLINLKLPAPTWEEIEAKIALDNLLLEVIKRATTNA